MRSPKGTAHEKRRVPFAATQFFNIPSECKDGECVFIEVKTPFSWNIIVWRNNFTTATRETQSLTFPDYLLQYPQEGGFPVDMDTLGYFIYMDEQEKKQNQQQEEEENDEADE